MGVTHWKEKVRKCYSCTYATDRDRDGDARFKCAFEAGDYYWGRFRLLKNACVMHVYRYDCLWTSHKCGTFNSRHFKGDLFEICIVCVKGE